MLSHCFLSQPIPVSILHLSISAKKVQPTKARDLAIALLILERDMYARILPADYISYLRSQPPSEENNINYLFQINGQITHWTKQVVLHDKLEERIKLFKFFVDTAKVTGHSDAYTRLITKLAGIL